MKKSIWMSVIFVCTALLVYIAWKKSSNTSTIVGADTEFAVSDTASITRIFIANKQGGTYKLDRQKDGTWTINDTIEANPININLLLSTIRNVEVQRNLNEAERHTVIKQLATEHLKVEIYVNGALHKTYYVGGATLNYLGTYFLMENSENPYVVYVRDFPGYLTPRYAVTNLGWRSRKIFSSTPATIQRVSVEYPNNPSENFTISYRNKKFEVEGATRIDTLRVAEYLLLFKGFHAEQFFENPEASFIDSLNRTKPMAIITVEDIDKRRSCRLITYPGQVSVSAVGRWESTQGSYWVSLQSIRLAKFLQSRKTLIKE